MCVGAAAADRAPAASRQGSTSQGRCLPSPPLRCRSGGVRSRAGPNRQRGNAGVGSSAGSLAAETEKIWSSVLPYLPGQALAGSTTTPPRRPALGRIPDLSEYPPRPTRRFASCNPQRQPGSGDGATVVSACIQIGLPKGVFMIWNDNAQA